MGGGIWGPDTRPHQKANKGKFPKVLALRHTPGLLDALPSLDSHPFTLILSQHFGSRYVPSIFLLSPFSSIFFFLAVQFQNPSPHQITVANFSPHSYLFLLSYPFNSFPYFSSLSHSALRPSRARLPGRVPWKQLVRFSEQSQ